MDTRDIPALMGRPLSPADSPADRDPPTDAALTTLSGVEPFSLIYLQVVRVTSGTRFLARFVGRADKARSMQQPLFAVGLPGLQPIDLHYGYDPAEDEYHVTDVRGYLDDRKITADEVLLHVHHYPDWQARMAATCAEHHEASLRTSASE